MKFWLSMMPIYEMEQLTEIARHAEAVGFHGITMPDHLVMPTRIESRYPYTEDGKMWWPEDTPWLDPWVTLGAMAAVTHKLRLASNIYLAALRDPFTAAKSLASVAALSGGRVVCGVSVGWIKEEYDLLGLDFKSRGRRMDELIAVMRMLWTGKEVSHHGEFFNFDHALMHPAPRQPIPVWCGGGTPPALRRAALNDGWLGLPLPLPQLTQTIESMLAIRRAAGLPEEGFDACVPLMQALTPEIHAGLAAIHVHNAVVIAPWMLSPWGEKTWIDAGDDIRDLAVKKKAMTRFAESVLSRFG
ncbi:MAG: TIGR03619 family F420-dependent LLM class oxidoreductase [Proteobacteria bacterium]|nr:TIGR03619 family F420-dependent LLM class oxidoreductase [Pseudomonadota bacterium]HQR03569.1 TIGR03619 family F420-dependent LLM class oxidoreductase [Rhodocyclaceae bacterium]